MTDVKKKLETESPEEVRRFVAALGAIGAARQGTPEFGSAVADAAILSFVERDFWSAILFADTLLVLEPDKAAEWMTFAGILRFHAIQSMSHGQRKELLKAQAKYGSATAVRMTEGRMQ